MKRYLKQIGWMFLHEEFNARENSTYFTTMVNIIAILLVALMESWHGKLSVSIAQYCGFVLSFPFMGWVDLHCRLRLTPEKARLIEDRLAERLEYAGQPTEAEIDAAIIPHASSATYYATMSYAQKLSLYKQLCTVIPGFPNLPPPSV